MVNYYYLISWHNVAFLFSIPSPRYVSLSRSLTWWWEYIAWILSYSTSLSEACGMLTAGIQQLWGVVNFICLVHHLRHFPKSTDHFKRGWNALLSSVSKPEFQFNTHTPKAYIVPTNEVIIIDHKNLTFRHICCLNICYDLGMENLINLNCSFSLEFFQ